jgi:hypothetical protein
LRSDYSKKEGTRTEEKKVCNKCGENLPATQEYFGKEKRNKDGLNGSCRACVVEYKQRYYTENKDRLSKQAKEYGKKNKDRKAEYFKKYREDNKDSLSALYKQWYLENKERLLEYQKQYRKDHEDYIRERQRQYYDKNKERAKQKGKQRYDENKEHINNINIQNYLKNREARLKDFKKYREKNKPKMAQQKRRWREEHPEQRKVSNQRRKAKKKQLPATLTEEQWQSCLKHFDYKDAYTGLSMNIISQDHYIPVSKGGPFSVDNIVPCEANINSSKGNRDFGIWYKKQKFYSPEREKAILEYLGYNKHGQQQLTLAL